MVGEKPLDPGFRRGDGERELPTFYPRTHAKYWLEKSFLGSGLKGQADLEFRDFLVWFAKDLRVSEI